MHILTLVKVLRKRRLSSLKEHRAGIQWATREGVWWIRPCTEITVHLMAINISLAGMSNYGYRALARK